MAYDIFRLVRKPGFVVRKVGEAYMVVPVGPRMKDYKGVITINETGAFLFEMMKTEQPFGTLVQALVKEYEISEETATTAATAFVYQCQEAHLLQSETMEQIPEGNYYMTEEVEQRLQEQIAVESKKRAEEVEKEKQGKEKVAGENDDEA
ncbi:MAG: PqqD family protein [Clostridia bacterium]